MFLGRITGSLVATQKVESMVGQKLLVIEPLRVNEKDQRDLTPTGRTFVAVDTLGAGEGTSRALRTGLECPLYAGDQTTSGRRGGDRNCRPSDGGIKDDLQCRDSQGLTTVTIGGDL